jgi:hypothetical protein
MKTHTIIIPDATRPVRPEKPMKPEQAMRPVKPEPAMKAMPANSNKGGAVRGLERAAAMSGRTMPTTGKPATAPSRVTAQPENTGLLGAAVKSGQTLPVKTRAR